MLIYSDRPSLKCLTLRTKDLWSKMLMEKDLIIPIEKLGVKILSIGFFIDKENPLSGEEEWQVTP